MALYGIALAQTYSYSMEYTKDSLSMKALVFVIWVLNTAHLAFTSHAVYHILVTSAFDLTGITSTVWSLPASFATHVVVGVVVLLYFTKLCFQLSAAKFRWWLLVVLLVPILLQLAFGIDTVVHMASTKQYLDYGHFLDSAMIPLLVAGAASNVMVSGALCTVLNKHKTTFKRTNSMISRLVTYSINRGILMFLTALIELLLMVLRRQSLWYVASEFITSGLYTNTFLATLNSRNTVREIPNQCSSVSIPLSNFVSDGSTVRSNNESGRVSRGHLGITRKTRYCTNGEVVDIVDLKPESTYTSENASDKV